MTHIERLNLCNKMVRYSNLINDEVGEYCKYLYQTCMRSDCMSEEFEKAIDEEVKRMVIYFEDNAEIVEETLYPEPYKIEKLEWKDE